MKSKLLKVDNRLTIVLLLTQLTIYWIAWCGMLNYEFESKRLTTNVRFLCVAMFAWNFTLAVVTMYQLAMQLKLRGLYNKTEELESHLHQKPKSAVEKPQNETPGQKCG